MPSRDGQTDSAGNLVRSDGSQQLLSDEIRAAMSGWLTDPQALADAVVQLNCQLGADQPFLAVSMNNDTTVAQPIRVCLAEADSVPGGPQLSQIAALL